MHTRPYRDDEPEASGSSPQHDLEFSTDGIQPAPDRASAHSNDENAPPTRQSGIDEVDFEPTARTRLLNHENWDAATGCGEENCNHGDISPRPWLHRSYGSFNSVDAFGGRYPGSIDAVTGEPPDAAHALLGDTFADGVFGGGPGPQKSTTAYLAERHGVKHKKLM